MSYLPRNFFSPWLCAAAAVCCCALGVPTQVMAQAQSQSFNEFQEISQTWLRSAVASAQSGAPAALRMEVTVGNLDSRLRLAPCGNVEPYLPPGARLWGKTRIGLRCVDGLSRWNVSLPVTVNAFGKAWVIKGQVPAGATLMEADVVETEVNWAEESAPVLRDPALWAGQIATRTLSTGQTVRQGMVKPAQVFQAGAQVRVQTQGAGFSVSADAQALSAGVIGQMVRVRMDNGRVTSGTVLDMRTVQIDL